MVDLVLKDAIMVGVQWPNIVAHVVLAANHFLQKSCDSHRVDTQCIEKMVGVPPTQFLGYIAYIFSCCACDT